MPESAQKVINELTAAGLLSADEITKFDQEIAVGVEALLKRLVEDDRITQYQADKFLAGQSGDIYFGDYIVMEELGRGGMGTVLLARHRRMDREVAIKILPVTTLDSESAVARFYQEVKVAAKLTHPNIVHAYDAGEHHGFHYLVMEYVRGHDLAQVLHELGPIPVSLALDYVSQAARGLEYAHRKGIVHRDIKPSNLLLDDEGTVKVLDMGLARIGKSGVGSGAEASMHLTTTGQVMGTVEYMSPEQAEDTRVADARSDIYSLGCTLYRLITGQAPFSRDTVVKTILAHREAPIPTMSTKNDPMLGQLDPLFQKMVAKNPDHRFQNTASLIQELEQLNQRLAQSRDEPTINEPISLPAAADFPTQMPGSSSSVPPTPNPNMEIVEPISHIPSSVNHPMIGHPLRPPSGAVSGSVSSAPGVDLGPQSETINPGSNPTVAPNSPSDAPHYIGMPEGISNPGLIGLKHHRGKTLVTMGALSLLSLACIIGLPLGIVTWVYASSDLKEMKNGLRDPAGRNLTRVGKYMGIVTVLIAILGGIAAAISGS